MKRPLIIGLTGSVGMGKSTVAHLFAKEGASVFCADECVHALLAPGGKAVRAITKLFSQTKAGRGVDRSKLAAAMYKNQRNVRAVESILHPLVWRARDAFIKKARKDQAGVVLLDIPLLFETGADRECDVVLCVHAAAAVQKERVMARPGMTATKFRAIKAQQMPSREKCRRADIVLRTDLGLAQTRKNVRKIWRFICQEIEANA